MLFNLRYWITALAIAVASMVVTAPATASSPEAWAAYQKEVVAACIAASQLRHALPGGKLVEFDDKVGFTALIIDGYYPQPHMKNQRGRELCLFDKRTRVAHVSEADGIAKNRRP